MIDEREVRLRCIEAASRSPIVHKDGPAAGVVEVATAWTEFVLAKAPDAIGPPGDIRLIAPRPPMSPTDLF